MSVKNGIKVKIGYREFALQRVPQSFFDPVFWTKTFGLKGEVELKGVGPSTGGVKL